MNIRKDELKKTLYSTFDLKTTETESNPELQNAIDNVFGKKTQGTPNLNQVLQRVRTAETESSTIPFPGRRKRKIIPFAAAAACLLLIPILLFRGSGPKISILTTQGRPEIIEGQNRRNPKPGSILSGKIDVSTGKNERLTLGIGRSRISINGSTRLAILPLSDKKGKTACTTALKSGLARFSIEKKAFSSFSVEFPEGRIVVTGTRFAVSTISGTTKVGVLHGSVSVFMKNRNTPIRLTTDNGVEIRKGKSRILPNAAGEDSFSEIFIRSAKKRPVTRKKTLQKTRRKPKPVKFSERLYMKDGSVITGKILVQNKNIVKVKTSYGVITVPWPKVKRVAYIK